MVRTMTSFASVETTHANIIPAEHYWQRSWQCAQAGRMAEHNKLKALLDRCGPGTFVRITSMEAVDDLVKART